jgi:hypothetical protein
MTDIKPRCYELVKMNKAAYGIGGSEPKKVCNQTAGYILTTTT